MQEESGDELWEWDDGRCAVLGLNFRGVKGVALYDEIGSFLFYSTVVG